MLCLATALHLTRNSGAKHLLSHVTGAPLSRSVVHGGQTANGVFTHDCAQLTV